MHLGTDCPAPPTPARSVTDTLFVPPESFWKRKQESNDKICQEQATGMAYDPAFVLFKMRTTSSSLLMKFTMSLANRLVAGNFV